MTDTDEKPETVADVIAELEPLVRARQAGIGDIAAKLLWDMKFSAAHEWPAGFPTMDSRVTPPQRETFDSSAAKIRLILATLDRIEALEAQVEELDFLRHEGGPKSVAAMESAIRQAIESLSRCKSALAWPWPHGDSCREADAMCDAALEALRAVQKCGLMYQAHQTGRR